MSRLTPEREAEIGEVLATGRLDGLSYAENYPPEQVIEARDSLRGMLADAMDAVVSLRAEMEGSRRIQSVD